MNILITGCAGFIGFHLIKNIDSKKINIFGVDNLNNYYSPRLKNLRLSILKKKNNFKFYKLDISDYNKLDKLFLKLKIDVVINLAAQAGVRYSLINPKDYIETNMLGFFNVLDLSKKYKIKKLIYASSSSVYGDKKHYPVREDEIINPKNIYSLSKKNNEELAEIYYEQYGFSSIGLRFFTVYGEWGRPDMLMIKYMLSKLTKKKFILNNKGNHYRDFTYIDDVTFVLKNLIFKKIKGNKILNVCSNKPIKVSKILNILNKLYGKPKIQYKNKLKIEVLKTHGSNSKIKKITNLKKFTDLDKGIFNLVNWAKKYLHKI
tara:strand:- start:1285 stop:2238 length:954 start_codon:yes stop_codon:yes gene_type:complete